MRPERSFKNSFSGAGRVKNAWAAALAETDSAEALRRLRELYGRFEERPDRTAELWLPFQQSLFASRFAPLLEAADFERLRDVGEQLARAQLMGLHQTWFPLAGQLTARGGPADLAAAVALYTRLYHSGIVYEEVRVGSAVALARLGAQDDGQLELYVDLMSRNPSIPQEVLDQVGRVLAAGFDDSTERVERAAALAALLSPVAPRTPGLARALGLGELLLHQRPQRAAEHFEAACHGAPTDGEALRGLIAARLFAGEYETAAALATGREQTLTARAVQLVDICRMLAWLEVPARAVDNAPAPLDRHRLAAVPSGPDLGPWRDYALGRAHLLEGDAQGARDHLVPVADALPERADIAYHAAWAQLLCGQAGGEQGAVRRCRDRLGPGNWALGCLLLDAEPETGLSDAQREEVLAPARQGGRTGAGDGLAVVARARLRLADGLRPEPLPAWDALDKHDAGVPELLEALRTLLAVALGGPRRSALVRLTRLPLFGRLPLAEQWLWHGLSALPDYADRARELLDGARAMGLARAGLARATSELAAGRPESVHALVEGLAGRKAELLRARAELRLGHRDSAAERLESLARRGMPAARYELGVLRLRQAAVEWATGRPEEAVQYAELAAARLTDAVVTGADSAPPVPADAPALSRAARLLAERALRPGQGRSPWRAVRHRARPARLLGLAQLVAEPGGTEPVLAEALAEWAGQDGTAHGKTAAGTLAAALARACALADTADDRTGLREALTELAALHPSPAVEEHRSRAARLAGLEDPAAVPIASEEGDGGAEAPEAPSPLFALAAAAAALDRGERGVAAELLAGPGGGVGAGAGVDAGAGAGAGADGDAAGGAGAAADGPAGADGDPAARIAAFLARSLNGASPSRAGKKAAGRQQATAETDSAAGVAFPAEVVAELPGVAAPLLVVEAAGLVGTDPARGADALTKALTEHDLSGLVDLGKALPALCARAARSRRRDGRTEVLTAAVRRCAEDVMSTAGDDGAGRDDGAAAGAKRGVATGVGTGAGGDESAAEGAAGHACGAEGAGGAGRTGSAEDAGGGGRTGSAEDTGGVAAGGGLDLLTLARCATAVGDPDTAERLWRRVLAGTRERAGGDRREAPGPGLRQEYGAYLCHRAVTAHAEGDSGEALDLLKDALRHLPEDHPARRIAEDLERGDRIDALFAHLLPQARVGWERPGRYAVLESAAATHPGLWRALAEDEAESPPIGPELADCLDRQAKNVPVHHVLAVLHREEALAQLADDGTVGAGLVTATALWMLLLAHPGFWEAFDDRLDGADTERLRRDLSGELLTVHRTRGARAMAEERSEQARLHLRCLTAVSEGAAATRLLLAEGPFKGALPGEDADLFQEFADRAARLLDEWAAELVRTAQERVDDHNALDHLPAGVDRDFEAGIDHLDLAVRQGFHPTALLCTILEWHNRWQQCLYEMGERDDMREVMGSAIRFALLLERRSVLGRPHLRENQALAAHYVDRGFLEKGPEDAIPFLERAHEWNPANNNAPQLLEQRREELLFGKALAELKARRYDRALDELARIPRTAGTKKTLDNLQASALINRGYTELDASRFDAAERTMNKARDIATGGDANDPKLVKDAEDAVRNVATALNNRAVALIDEAMEAFERSGSYDRSGLMLNLSGALPLLAGALRIDPRNQAARNNENRVKDLLRRLR